VGPIRQQGASFAAATGTAGVTAALRRSQAACCGAAHARPINALGDDQHFCLRTNTICIILRFITASHEVIVVEKHASGNIHSVAGSGTCMSHWWHQQQSLVTAEKVPPHRWAWGVVTSGWTFWYLKTGTRRVLKWVPRYPFRSLVL